MPGGDLTIADFRALRRYRKAVNTLVRDGDRVPEENKWQRGPSASGRHQSCRASHPPPLPGQTQTVRRAAPPIRGSPRTPTHRRSAQRPQTALARPGAKGCHQGVLGQNWSMLRGNLYLST